MHNTLHFFSLDINTLFITFASKVQQLFHYSCFRHGSEQRQGGVWKGISKTYLRAWDVIARIGNHDCIECGVPTILGC
jgi:hypothetical protein